MKERLLNKTVKDKNDCLNWTGATKGFGYGYTTIGSRTDGTRKTITTHRAMWIATHGSIPDGIWVLHHCDNPKCINPDHLYLGDRADNVRDRETRNRNNHTRKLTDEDVLFIHKNKNVIKSKDLAKMFGVSYHTIKDIWCGKIYPQLKPTPPSKEEE